MTITILRRYMGVVLPRMYTATKPDSVTIVEDHAGNQLTIVYARDIYPNLSIRGGNPLTVLAGIQVVYPHQVKPDGHPTDDIIHKLVKKYTINKL